MKAMRLTDIREMEMQEVPDPPLREPGDVLVRLGSLGVCGSDIHYYNTGRIGDQVVEYPFTVGHECAGTVEAVGPGVRGLEPGDRVAVEPAMPCFDCDQCRAGRHNTCRRLRFLGCPGQAEGSLSEKIVMPETSLFKLGPGTSLDQGSLSEPLAIGVYATRQCRPLEGKRVGILGFGPIGMSCLLPARHYGAEKIYATDRIPERLELARRTGADWAGNPESEDVVAEITAREPLLLDVVFECCGQQEAVDQAVELLRPGGRLMLIGIPEGDRIAFDPHAMRRKEIEIRNVRRQNGAVEETLELIESGAIDVEQMITHRFGFGQARQAFELVASYREGVMKAMIDFEA